TRYGPGDGRLRPGSRARPRPGDRGRTTRDDPARRQGAGGISGGLVTVLLELTGIRAAYDAITVLHGVDLRVRAGEVVALLGPNGAGKTTTLQVAAGVHPVAAGTVRLGGRTIDGAAARDLARAGVCLIPEGR